MTALLDVLDIYALKQVNPVGVYSDGDRAVAHGSNTVSGNSTLAHAGNVSPMVYYWSSTSAASPADSDDLRVVRPAVGSASTGNGRWLILASDITKTMTSGDTTPTVAGTEWLITAGTTAITNFDDGFEGQEITVQRGASDIVVTHDITKISLNGRANRSLTLDDPRLVMRLVGGVWYEQSGSAMAILTAKADKNGTSPLTISAPNGSSSYLMGQTAGTNRWILNLKNASPETGSNSGSDFAIERYADGGGYIGPVLSFARASGIGTFNQTPIFPSAALSDNSTKGATTAWSRAAFEAKTTIVATDPAYGMVADCTGPGLGTDNSAALQAAINAWVAAGTGSVLVIPQGRYRLATANIVADLALKYQMSFICYGTLTTDSVAGRFLTFKNGYQLTVKANLLEGGRYDAGTTPPYYVDYSTTADVVSGGGQEAFYFRSVFNLVVDIHAAWYAGRVVRHERVAGDTLHNVAIKGSICTTRQDDVSKPRTAQALWADNGSSFFGNWGSLDKLICDFDYYGPVWQNHNDIYLGYVDAAFAKSGLLFDGCVMVLGDTWYVGDIDSNASNVHIQFKKSAANRQSGNIDVASIVGLNTGTVVKVSDLDPATDCKFHSVKAIGSGSNLYTAALNIDNSPNIDATVWGNGTGTSLVLIDGANTDLIKLKVAGTGLTGDFISFGSAFGGTAQIEGTLKSIPAGFSGIKVANGGAHIDLTNSVLQTSAGNLVDLPSTNLVRWVSGAAYTSGGGAAFKNGYKPYVIGDNADPVLNLRSAGRTFTLPFALSDGTNTYFAMSTGGKAVLSQAATGYSLDIAASVNNFLGMRIYNQSSGTSATGYLQFGNDTNAATASIGLNSSTNTGGFGGANGFFFNQGLAADMAFAVGGTLRAKFDGATGNFLFVANGAMGYGTGAGGAVVQTGSTSASVTLNRATGQITMDGAALAANTAVAFTLSNNKIGPNDVVFCNIASGSATGGDYLVQGDSISSGSCRITLRNISPGSLSEALVLNFVVIKGAAA